MKIFDYTKLALTKSGKLVAKSHALIIPSPINSTNCPVVHLNNLGETKPSDGQEYTVLGGAKKVPIMMKEGSFYCKAGTFEGDKAFLGIRIYLGSSDMSNNVLYKDIPYSEGVLDDNGNLVFTYDYPVFETGRVHAYFHATYNSDSGEGEQFIQNAYMTVRHINVKAGKDPVPPEPVDPIEEYTVQGVSVDHSVGGSDPETYTVSWYACDEDWFDENCQYEVSVKQGETLIESVEINYDSEFAQFDPYSYIDDTEYTFEVRVVKGDKKSIAGTASDTYNDPFHEQTIYIDDTDLDISSEGDTDGYTLTWENIYDANKYEVYLDGELYKTTSSSSISISDKNPGDYDLEIKAYNHKNTMISESTGLVLNDPMPNVNLEISESDITYNSDDTISISSLTASYDGYSLPEYIENRLNNESLEIIIDDDTVYTGKWNANIPNIDVSTLKKGEHNISFTLTTTYGSDAISSPVTFNVDRCGLIGNSINVDATCDLYEPGVRVVVTFENDISESDNIEYIINGQSDWWSQSSGKLEQFIDPSEYESYGIIPGSDNTISVEVSCYNGDHNSEPLTGEKSVYVHDVPEY